jgi:hypothetical protein
MGAFLDSSLQSIVIPRTVEFIDGSAFGGVVMNSVTVEEGNAIFEMRGDILMDVRDDKLIRNFSR